MRLVPLRLPRAQSITEVASSLAATLEGSISGAVMARRFAVR